MRGGIFAGVMVVALAPGVWAQPAETGTGTGTETGSETDPSTSTSTSTSTEGEPIIDEVVTGDGPLIDEVITDSEPTVDGVDESDALDPIIRTTTASEPSFFAGIQLKWSGHIQSEAHYRMRGKSGGAYYDPWELPAQFVRNENTLKLKLEASMGRFHAVSDLDLDWIGFSDVGSLRDLSNRDDVQPVRIDAHALYLDARNLFVDGLDVRIGQQVVQWGVGDQFNPTNTLNPDDLENVLLFGQQAANLMARVDYAISDFWTISGVLVPVFKPAVLPVTGSLALTSVDRLPFKDDALRWRLHSEREQALQLDFGTVVNEVVPRLPKPNASNMQGMIRVAGNIADQDIALSYYVGRNDFPVPSANFVGQRFEDICNPDDDRDCLQGLLETSVNLRYPKMQVVGLNIAGELDLLGWISSSVHPIGYRLEVGLFFPQEQRFRIVQNDVTLAGATVNGEYDYHSTVGYEDTSGRRPLVFDETPFAKWTLGLDYTFGRHVLAAVMWVHGMVDEFGAGDFISAGSDVRAGGVGDNLVGTCVIGADGEQCAEEILRPRLGDYLVVGVDIRFLEMAALLRLFAVWELSGYVEDVWDRTQGRRVRRSMGPFSDGGLSLILYPEFEYNFGNGLTLGVGALIQLGEDYTKFGDPAAGGSIVFGRARYAF